MKLHPALTCAVLSAALGCGGLLRGPEGTPVEDARLRRENVELRRAKTVAEVELARLRQEVTRLEAELTAARDQLARRPEPAVEPAAEAPEAGGPEAIPAPVAEESLSDAELDIVTTPSEEPETDSYRPEADEAAASPPVSAAARARYDESYTFYHEKRYAEAEAGFENFLARDPGTDLADNAQFWIGECRFARGEYEGALEAFLRTIERYPSGNKVSDALFKAGRCLEAMGDRERAAATYEEVVRRFRDSAAAIAAQERLADLR